MSPLHLMFRQFKKDYSKQIISVPLNRLNFGESEMRALSKNYIKYTVDYVKGWMQHFMAGFFLVFCFFKLLDLKAFVKSYATYDIIAKRWQAWGYVYGFIELGLGIAYLTGLNPLLTNAITFVVMSVSVVGVLQSVLNKRKIRCACLGAVFNLPMSTDESHHDNEPCKWLT